MSPKKIIIVGPAHPLRGGIAAFNERMANELINEGHDVQIITFSLQYPGFLFPGKTQFSSEPAPKNIPITVEVNSVNPLNWIKIGNKIKALKPDLLILRFWIPFMGPCLGTIGKIAKKNKHTEVIGFLDNVIPHEHRTGDKQLTNYFIKSCDRFIAMSKQVVDELRQFTNKSCKMIPHPVYDHYGDTMTKSTACAHLQLNENQKYLLFFGFIRNYKGLDILLEAMADSRIKKAGIKLIVAGEFYGDASPYHQLIEKSGNSESIILHTDYIADDEVKYFFSAADLIVQPYKSATQSGISQLAYHFEKPMVVTNVGGLPEIVHHLKTGYVVEVNHQAIADAIIDFFEKNNSLSFAPYLKEEKKKYSWESLAKGILNQ
jgi:glycosyltransferase involved in cell wall biosynthesis